MSFNKKEHKEELKRRIQEFSNFCILNKIPMFLTACISDNGKSSEYVSEMISPDVLEPKLSDDRFPKFVNVGLGFETVPANEVIEDIIF